jgi:malate dehydrogenase (oxaloacetate-decarboxylating)(NADP+)
MFTFLLACTVCSGLQAKVAAAVASKAYELGVARALPMPRNLLKRAESHMYQVDYRKYK